MSNEEKPNKVARELRVKRLEFCGGCQKLLVASEGEWGFRFEGEIGREEGWDSGGHEVFFHGHKTKSKVFGHAHIKRWSLKYSIIFFINFFFIIKKYFFMCVTKHFLFGHVTILEFPGKLNMAMVIVLSLV